MQLKVKTMKTLFRVESGSSLYGTRLPTSDTDFKAVHLPPYDDIIRMRTTGVVKKSTGSDKVKNTVDDIDDESFVLRKFFDMLIGGDMVAQELLFVPPERALVFEPEWKKVYDNRHSFIASDIKGFVGYIQRQTNTYSTKGLRVESVRSFVEVMNSLIDKYSATTKFRDIPEIKKYLDPFVEKYDHAQYIMMPKSYGNDEMEEYFELVNRKVSMNVALKEVVKLFAGVLKDYGSRSLAAEQNKGVDWKSVYHAIRVSEQAIELLKNGVITFPRPNVSELLDIRAGKYPYSEIGGRLEDNLNELLELRNTTSLPKTVNVKLLENILFELHENVVKEKGG